MSDQLSNAYSNFTNNFSQGLPSQQAQHRPPQQLGAQPILTGIRKPEDARVWQQQLQQQRQQQQQPQQQQQQPLQQQQQHSGGESIHVATPQQQQQQQVCLAITHQSSPLPRISSK